MATIKAVLELSDEKTGGRISDIQFNAGESKSNITNNISVIKKSTSINSVQLGYLKKNNGEKVNLIGTYLTASIGNAKYNNSYSGLIFGASTYSGNFNLQLDIYGVDLFQVKIYFDKATNQYPTEYQITNYDGTKSGIITESNYGEEFNADECSIIFSFSVTSDYTKPQSIKFYNWKQPNTQVSITYIEALTTNIELHLDHIDNIESTNELTSDLESNNYGLLANTGSLVINDYDEVFYNYVKNEYFKFENLKVKMYYNEKLVQEHIVENSDYINETKLLKLDLTNKIEKWQNSKKETGDISFNGENRLYDILEEIFSLSELNESLYDIDLDNTLTNKVIVEGEEIDMYEYFHRIIVPNSFTLKSDTFYNQLVKVCEITQTYFNVNDNGELKFYSARPIMFSSEENNILVINDNLITSDLELSLIPKNNIVLPSNELYDVGAIFSGTLMSKIISSNLEEDYAKGVKSLKVSIFINYIKNINGTTIKNFENGSIIETGDVCVIQNVDGTPKYVNKNGESIKWRVLSRTFKYEGQPLIDLQLQEIR